MIGGIISLANSMGAALSRAAGVAPDQQAAQAMRDRHAAEAASLESLEAQRAATESFTAAEEARNSATEEQLRLQREVEAVRKLAGERGATLTTQQATDFATASLAAEEARRAARSAGGGGGGSRSRGGGGGAARERLDDYQQEAQAIRDRTLALEAEAASIVAAAASNEQYGDALEYARTRAELLHAAQQAGKVITPELSAEIDRLAQGYVTAGLNAEQAAERLEKIKDQSERGKAALSDMFGSISDGSMSAKEAVGNLLMQIAQVQMMKAVMGLPGMGGIASGLGGLLTPRFATGGMHQGGLRIVGENGPELEATGAARVWNASQTRNMLSGSGSNAGGGTSSIMVDLSPDLIARVLSEAEGQSARISQKTAAAQGRASANMMNQKTGSRRRT